MDKKVLIIKTVISSLAIILGVVIFSLGICYAVNSLKYFELCFGVIICLCAVALIISAILKIVCYQMLIGSSGKATEYTPAEPTHVEAVGGFEVLKNRLHSLQRLNREGIITDEEYEALRSDIISKSRL